MSVETKLKELGYALPEPPRPGANYVPAMQAGDLLFLSGTTCYVNGELLSTGRVGQELTIQDGYSAARQAALNLLSVVKAVLGDLERIEQVVKLNGYVNSAPDFDRQPEVINGASDLLVELFGSRGKHARTAIGVRALPGHIPVEIELIVRIRL
jgi:enamine deaminase RidA (YjgF/YER057c/UK114 family)